MADATLQQLQQTGKMTAGKAGPMSVRQFFQAHRQTLADLLPKHIDPDRLLRLAQGALRTSPRLNECAVETLMGGLVLAAQFGLEPNTPLGECYLIPFRNNKLKTLDVQFQLGYPGVMELGRRSGKVESYFANVVRDGDKFDYAYGREEVFVHKPAGTTKPVAFVYAYAHLKDGGFQFVVFTPEEINANHRERSQAYRMAKRDGRTDTPWITDWDWMAKKSAIKQLCKLLPKSIEQASAIALDDLTEAGKAPRLDSVLEGDFSVLTPDPDAPPPDDGGDQEKLPAKKKAATKKAETKPQAAKEAEAPKAPAAEPPADDPRFSGEDPGIPDLT